MVLEYSINSVILMSSAPSGRPLLNAPHPTKTSDSRNQKVDAYFSKRSFNLRVVSFYFPDYADRKFDKALFSGIGNA